MASFVRFDSPSRSRFAIVTALASAAVLLGPGGAEAGVAPPDVVQGNIVLQEGDTPTGGAAVTNVNVPWVNDAGEVAFSGNYDDGDHFVFIGAAVVWQGTDDAMSVLDTLEPAADSNGAGQWVYTPDIDGLDGIYTDLGPFAFTGQTPSAMGIPDGAVFTFLSTPMMTDAGEIFFRAGLDLDGDGGTDIRSFQRSPDGLEASSELLFLSGDLIDMEPLDDSAAGIDADFAVSRNGMHRIHVLNLEGDTDVDGLVWVDGTVVARELDPTGDGDDWQNFELVAINNNGNYLFTGDTNGATASDDFIAYNGAIAVREGDTLDGIQIAPGASPRFAAVSNLDQAVHTWGYNGPAGFRETVFFECDANDFGNQTIEVFTSVETELDVDGDGSGDYTIADITLTGPVAMRAMGDTPFIYMPVELDDGVTATEAMIEVPVSCCGNGFVNPFEDCDDGNDDDTDDCIAGCVAASCGDGFVQDGVEECDDGNDDDTDDCPTTCVTASCGDGFVQDGVEECDDGNDDDTDDCVAGCIAATCGDGFVQDGVEECDDGNTDDGDGCASDCTLRGGADTGSDETGSVDTGADETGGEGGSGGDSGPGPSTLSGAGTSIGGGSGSETGDGTGGGGSAGAVLDDDGCTCTTSGRHPLRGAVWSLLGLGLLGLGRRRRR